MSKCPNCFYEFGSWNECVAINNILECPECEEHFELKAVPLNQPQLRIPKSVAYEIKEKDLDGYTICSCTGDEPLYDLSDELFDWVSETENWIYIVDAYLAGKALGVDLVKVVEG